MGADPDGDVSAVGYIGDDYGRTWATKASATARRIPDVPPVTDVVDRLVKTCHSSFVVPLACSHPAGCAGLLLGRQLSQLDDIAEWIPA